MARSRLSASIAKLWPEMKVALARDADTARGPGLTQVERPAGSVATVAEAPTAYEQVTRERAEGLGRRLDSIEFRLNAMLLLLAGSLLTEVWKVIHP